MNSSLGCYKKLYNWPLYLLIYGIKFILKNYYRKYLALKSQIKIEKDILETSALNNIEREVLNSNLFN